jgi:hypothetical protein
MVSRFTLEQYNVLGYTGTFASELLKTLIKWESACRFLQTQFNADLTATINKIRTTRINIFTEQPPAITSFSPTSGLASTTNETRYVTIQGSKLVGVSSVTFNNVESKQFSDLSINSIRAAIPINATSGFIKVTTPNGTATSTTQFTVTP